VTVPSEAFYLTTPPCIRCRKTATFEVLEEQYTAVRNNDLLIQDIFPDWPAEKREQLITGTHPECWKKIFGEEDDDGDDSRGT